MIINIPFYGKPEYEYEKNDTLCKIETDILVHYAMMTGGNIIEIGCRSGLTSRHIAINCPQKIIYAVDCMSPTDPLQGYNSSENWTKCNNISNVKCVNANSQSMDLSQFLNVTMAFIDGDHSYRGVSADYENMKKLIKKGRIFFHDFKPGSGEKWFGIEKLIIELSEKNDISVVGGTQLAMLEVG